MGNDYVIETNNVTKRFGPVTALEGVDFHIPRGEVTALVGDNGAGKSTLIKIISGVMQPDEGQIFVDSQLQQFNNPQDAWEAGISTIYQELALAGKLNVFENVFLGRELVKRVFFLPILDRAKMRRITKEKLEELEADLPSLDTPAESLSGGQRQAVAIARALLIDAKVIIMDEPTAALAVAEAQKVIDLIKDLKYSGTTVLLISHNLNDVFMAADSINVLRKGHLVGHRRTSETDSNEIVKLITGITRDEAQKGGIHDETESHISTQ